MVVLSNRIKPESSGALAPLHGRAGRGGDRAQAGGWSGLLARQGKGGPVLRGAVLEAKAGL